MGYPIDYLIICLLIRVQVIESKYLVDTPKCQIIDLKAWREDAREHFAIVSPDLCSSKRLLTFVIQNETYAKVIVDEKAKKQYSQMSIKCCYRWIERSTSVPVPDNNITLSSKCKHFSEELPINNRSVLIKCYDENSLVYSNVHTAVTVDDKQYKKMVNAKKSKDKPLSLLIIGIDSVSRLNFQRTMPSTRAFMLENNWIEYKAYNKVGENTFPNVMAMLTGKNRSYIKNHCDPYVRGQLENCPFIWNSFKRYEFVTAYAEDAEYMATFNYGGMKGFVQQPTDFYFKPFMKAARTLKVRGECSGPVHDAERILKITESFLDTFLEYKFFGLFWMNTFSHDRLNDPTAMDKKVVAFFENLKSKQVFDEVMVMLVADHGMRFGDIALTTGGWLESRLPLLQFSIPPWFKDKYPKQYKNIVDNSKELISTYDLYMTIQDVLHFSNFTYKPIKTDSCTLCQSLFKSIEKPRSCAEIGIDSNYCTCVEFYPTRIKEPYVKKAAFAALLWIQEQILLLSPKKFHFCVDYMLGKIISASVSRNQRYGSRIRHSKIRLKVVFETVPKAHFDAIVGYVMDSTAPFISEDNIKSFEVEHVDRVDRYGNTSDCIDVKILKNYCYCKNRVPKK